GTVVRWRDLIDDVYPEISADGPPATILGAMHHGRRSLRRVRQAFENSAEPLDVWARRQAAAMAANEPARRNVERALSLLPWPWPAMRPELASRVVAARMPLSTDGRPIRFNEMGVGGLLLKGAIDPTRTEIFFDEGDLELAARGEPRA